MIKSNLIKTLIIEFLKVIVVLPSPFNILEKVVVIYINGHNNERVWIKYPAEELWKIVIPKSLPNIKKIERLNNPIIIE